MSTFIDPIADRLAALPGVKAVALGGSRAQGRATDTSDWDLAVYYRGAFDPDDLRALGWPGEVSDIGGWGGGVFNGGAWLDIDGRRVDVHYRDLHDIADIAAKAGRGEFHIEPLLFHVAGVPSYLPLAELALNRTLRGSLPRPAYPSALRQSAATGWWERGRMIADYAEKGAAAQGRVALTLGLASEVVMCAAHAICAAQGRWVTNEKRLVQDAGLEHVEAVLAGQQPLTTRLAAVRQGCDEAVARVA